MTSGVLVTGIFVTCLVTAFPHHPAELPPASDPALPRLAGVKIKAYPISHPLPLPS